MMNAFDQYDVSMTEVHHTHKLDAPSGTAISLAEDIIGEVKRIDSWTIDEPKSAAELPISAIREGEVPGIHTVKYDSEVDYIEITHSAKSRRGFAFGAVLAAEFCQGRKGILSMKNLLDELA
jgi:4-hydroxy-tetrahydrodipicolinate reductase